jgi:hypothetical protein
MVPGFWAGGRFYPLIMGGAEGAPAPEAPASAPEADAAPEGEITPQPGTDAGDEPAEREQAEEKPAGALETLAAQLLGNAAPASVPALTQPAPPIEDATRIRQQAALLLLQHQQEQAQLQAVLPYLPEDQQEQALVQWERLTAQRERQLVQLERQLLYAEQEPRNRDLAIEELVRLAKQDNADIDEQDLRERLRKMALAGASAGAVLQRAVEYVSDHRRGVLRQRAAKQVDKLGGGGVGVTSDRWRRMSTLEKLAYAIRESDRQRRGK